MFKVYIIWGISKYGEEYEFNTADEKAAFLYGIEESQGFNEYIICETEEEYNENKRS